MLDDSSTKEEARSDRRRFIKYLGLGGTAVVAGCVGGGDGGGDGSDGGTSGDGSDGGDGETTETSMDSGSARKGGHLRIGVSESPETLNGLQTVTAEGYILAGWMYSKLFQIQPDLTVKGDLVTEYETSNNLKQWDLTLDENATWHHNGEAVLAEDVKATFDTIADPDMGLPAKGQNGPIDSVEVVSDRVARVNLSDPFVDEPKKLAGVNAPIVPKAVLDEGIDQLASQDFGSGAFKIDDFEIGSHFTLSRYDDYFKTDADGNALPYLDKVTMRVFPEAEARTNALLNGEIDIMMFVPPTQWQRVDKSSKDISATERAGGWFYPLCMDQQVEPFDDIRVVNAIQYAIGREEQLQGAQQGFGVQGQDTPISPAMEFYADLSDKFGPGAKIDKAKELLAEAGYEDGIKIPHNLKVTPGHHPGMGATSELYQAQLQKAGIETEIQNVTWETFIGDVETKEPFYESSYALRSTEDQLLSNLFVKDNVFYGTNWHVHSDVYEKFLNLKTEAQSTDETSARQEKYREIQKLIRDYGAFVVPYFTTILGAYWNHVGNYKVDPTNLHLIVEDLYLTDDAQSG